MIENLWISQIIWFRLYLNKQKMILKFIWVKWKYIDNSLKIFLIIFYSIKITNTNKNKSLISFSNYYLKEINLLVKTILMTINTHNS
jgi:hypothetical protein